MFPSEYRTPRKKIVFPESIYIFQIIISELEGIVVTIIKTTGYLYVGMSQYYSIMIEK